MASEPSTTQPKVELAAFANTWIMNDLGATAGEHTILDARSVIPEELIAAAGVSDLANPFPVEFYLEGLDEESSAVLAAFGKIPQLRTVSYTGHGAVNGMHYEVFTTHFADSLQGGVLISKQVIFIDFGQINTQYEVRKYQFRSSAGESVGFFVWRSLAEPFYRKVSMGPSQQMDTQELTVIYHQGIMRISTSLEGLARIEVYDSKGSLVHTDHCHSGDGICAIHVGQLQSGLYTVSIETRGKLQRARVGVVK
jgi:hypothetical protein